MASQITLIAEDKNISNLVYTVKLQSHSSLSAPYVELFFQTDVTKDTYEEKRST
jgi:hypothetical protein